MRRCYIFDIDGTLADLSHRLHHIKGETKDWRAFFRAVGQDTPIEHICHLARDLASAGCVIVYVSGRSDECRAATEDWIRMYGLPDGRVFMRAEGDHRPDDLVKAELLAELIEAGFAPVMAFDDRNRVVEQWRSNGVPCAQVAPGDF